MAQKNLLEAVLGTLNYKTRDGKTVNITPHPALIIARPRSLNLDERHLLVNGMQHHITITITTVSRSSSHHHRHQRHRYIIATVTPSPAAHHHHHYHHHPMLSPSRYYHHHHHHHHTHLHIITFRHIASPSA